MPILPLRRFFSVPFVFLALAVGGSASNPRAEAAPARDPAGLSETVDPAAPGRLIDIGGYRLHLISMGQGDPAVVMISGSGDFSFDWGLVQPQVAAFARACAYDRAGDAWSDPGPVPRTMRQEAYELHLLLEKAGLKGPYVLVGHSLGGLIARVFAARFPRDAAGMVLVDATDPDTTLDMNGKLVRMRKLAKGRPVPAEQTLRTSPPQPPSAADIRRFQDYQKRLGAASLTSPYDKLPAPNQAWDVWARSRPPRAARGEDLWPEELQQMYEETRTKAHPLGDIPLIVLGSARETPPPADKTAAEWKRLGDEKRRQRIAQSGLSRNGKIIFDKTSGHAMQFDHPERVIQAIREVVAAARRAKDSFR